MSSRETVKILSIVYSIVVIAFVASPFTVLSQDIAGAQLRWTSTSTVDLKAGDFSSYNSATACQPPDQATTEMSINYVDDGPCQ